MPARIGWASLHGHLQRTARSDESNRGRDRWVMPAYSGVCPTNEGVASALSLLLPPGRRHCSNWRCGWAIRSEADPHIVVVSIQSG